METTKGLFLGKLSWMQFLLSAFLLTACSQQKAPPQNSSDAPVDQKAAAIREWRESRVAARARAETERAFQTPTNSALNTNVIDSAKASNALNSLSMRLKKIVGDAYENTNSIREKAEKGDAAAQAELAATFVREGDFESALKWYRKAAEQGNIRGEHGLGVAFVLGQGTDIDYAEGVKWFKKAAEKGHIESQYSLGVRYVKGDHVEQSFAEAVKWFSLAANQGQPDSQVSLARRYAAGEGVQKDIVEGYKWALIADNYWSAAGVRESLVKSMTPEQITEAEQRAKAFTPVKTSQ